MGSSYSVGPLPLFLNAYLRNLSDVDLRAKRYNFLRKSNDKYVSAFHSRHLKQALDVNDTDAFKISQLLGFPVNPIELWCGLILAAPCEPAMKVSFCFETFDFNTDKFLSLADIYVMINCACSGLSKLKSISPPPAGDIKKFMTVLSRGKNVHYSDKGEVSLVDFKSFILSHDTSRSYLASLGTVVVAVDKVKLVSQRGDLLKSIADTENSLRVLESEIGYFQSDTRLYLRERGGDSDLIRMDDDKDSNLLREAKGHEHDIGYVSKKTVHTKSSNHSTEASSFIMSKTSFMPSLPLIEDARVFDSIGHNQNQLGNLAELKNIAWKMQFMDDDGLASIADPNVIVDVLECAGLNASIEEAVYCLNAVPRNQLGRFSLGQLLKLFMSLQSGGMQSVQLFEWQRFCSTLESVSGKLDDSIQSIKQTLSHQYSIKTITNDTQELISAKEFDKTMSSMSSWQRQRLSLPSSKLFLKCNFGSSVDKEDKKSVLGSNKISFDEINPRGRPVKSTSNRSDLQSDGGGAGDNVEVDDDRGISIDVTLTLTMSGVDAGGTNVIGNCVQDLAEINSSSVLSTFKADNTAESFESASWLILKLNDDITRNKSRIVATTLKNFFTTHRMFSKNVYDHVEVKILQLSESAGTGNDPIMQSVKSKQFAVVYLLSRKEFIKEIERLIPKSIFVTRGLRYCKFSCRVNEDLSDIFSKSAEFLNFERRMFGPQEEELGEELMNPIKFAKFTRQRKDIALEVSKSCTKLSLPELRDHCQSRGYSTDGNLNELIIRVKNIFDRQAAIVGFGEISNFGRHLIEELVKKICKQETSSKGVTLWEINELLSALDSPTLYDTQEFQSLMSDEQLLRDAENNLAFEGLINYYEKYGRLSSNLFSFGIGSLDDIISGQLKGDIHYDPEAFASMLNLLLPQSSTNKLFSQIGIAVSSTILSSWELKHVKLSRSLSAISSTLGVDLSSVSSFLKTPSAFANLILSLTDALACGDSGIIFALRNQLQSQFGKFFDWEELYEEVLNAAENDMDFGDQLSDDEVESVDINSKSFQSLDKKLDEVLPSSIDITPIVQKLASLEAQLRFVNNLMNGEVLRLSRSEIESMKDIAAALKTEINDLKESKSKFRELLPGHFCAVYDALKLYTSGVASFGLGTKEINLHVDCKGLDFLGQLPSGKGEKSKQRTLAEEKLLNAQRRKEAAAAAIRRARNRAVTPAVEVKKPSEGQLKSHLMQDIITDQIAMLFSELTQDYNNMKSMIQKSGGGGRLGVVKKWESLLLILRDHSPQSIKHATCMNNTACSIYRYYEKGHAKQKYSLKLLQNALQILFSKAFIQHAHDVPLQEQSHVNQATEDLVAPTNCISFNLIGNIFLDLETFSETSLSGQFLNAIAVLSLNYFCIMKMNNVKFLTSDIDYLEHVFKLSSLPEAQYQDLIFEGQLLFTASDTFPDLDDLISSNLVETSEPDMQSVARSAQTSKLSSQKSAHSSALTDSTAAANKQEAIKKRRDLYHLIQSGKITDMFESASKKVLVYGGDVEKLL